MTALIEAIRQAIRALRARPATFFVSVATLALAIGASTAVFTVIDALMLRPLPYPDPDRVVELQTRARLDNRESVSPRFTADAWRLLRQQSALFDAVETEVFATQVMLGAREPETIGVSQLSAGVLPMLGIYPRLGRPFTADDATRNGGRVLLLSDALWRERFGGDPAIVGRTIVLDDVPYEIVGVMPRSFRFPRPNVRAWRPLAPPAERPGARPPQYELVARLRAGIPLEQAQRDLRALASQLHAAGALAPGRVPEFTAITTINPGERAPLYMLLGAVLLVLGIACANVMNLGLTHGSLRRRELAVRAAIGASRPRLMTELILETAVVCTIGGAAGVWLAYVAVDALAPLIPTNLTFLAAHEIRIDARVLAFTTVLVVVSALLAGVVPALRGSRASGVDTLKSAGMRTSASRGERRLLGSIAVAQCALALTLLAGAGLLIKSFLTLQAVSPGFDTGNLLVLQLPLGQSAATRYPTAESKLAFFDRLAADVRALRGVRAVAIAGGTPPMGGGFRGAVIETSGGVRTNDYVTLPFAAVRADYFATMGIRILAGRVFSDTEPRTTVVIDEVFAKRFWGSIEAAVGARFRMGTESNEPWHTIVGVAADVKMMGLDDRLGEGMEFYYPMERQGRGWDGLYCLVVRTETDPEALLPAIKERVWTADPKLPIYKSADMRQMIADSLARPRFFFVLLTLFAAVAATIAAFGIYAVFSYLVTQRTREMGIRVALGATSGQISRMILRDGALMAVVGAALGLAGAWGGSRVLATLLFHTAPTDAAALGSGVIVLLTLALLACYIPARRARRVDPVAMLRLD